MKKLWLMMFIACFLIGCQADEINVQENNNDVPVEIAEDLIETEAIQVAEFTVEENLDINYVKKLETNLVYTISTEGVYKAETEHFRIRSYGQPNSFINYAVDFLEEVYGFYLSHYQLDKIPRITLHYYLDKDTYNDLSEIQDSAGFHSFQDIHLRMPSTFNVSGEALKERINSFVYATGVHEFNHILQYNANNFALSNYEERWLLEALAEYESNLILVASGSAAGHKIEMESYDDFRADKQYEYEYGPYFVEFLVKSYDLSMLDIFKNPNLEEYLEMNESTLFEKWLSYMHENYQTLLESGYTWRQES